MRSLEQQLDDIVADDTFINKVHAWMTMIGHEWAATEGVPSPCDIVNSIRVRGQRFIDEPDTYCCSSGGIVICRNGDNLDVTYSPDLAYALADAYDDSIIVDGHDENVVKFVQEDVELKLEDLSLEERRELIAQGAAHFCEGNPTPQFVLEPISLCGCCREFGIR